MTIREYLKQGPILFDGAMGTYYAELYPDSDKCELANIYEPERILEIHKAYIEAGAHAIKTNTFGSNPVSFDGRPEQLLASIREGYRLACKAAAEYPNCFVFADIGQFAGDQGDEESEIIYRSVVEEFLNLGAKHFLFETFSFESSLAQVARMIREREPDAFIIVSFAVTPDGFTRSGASGEELYRIFDRNPDVDAVGFNCVSGAHHLLHYIKSLSRGTKPLSVMPNAGYPTVVDGRTFFGNSPDYFAHGVSELVGMGIGIVGGCCGSNPEFIRQTAKRLEKGPGPIFAEAVRPEEEQARPNTAESNAFWEKLESGKRVLAVEVDPPADADIQFFAEAAQTLKKCGADAITIADCPISRARADSSILACKLKREFGIEPIPHMTCRDRNINATKALLLGLHIDGVNNVLVVTGDPIPGVDRGEIKSVFNFTSPRLAAFIRTLNGELGDHPFRVYGALNVNAVNFDAQLKHAKNKIENGVSAFLTQPVLSPEGMENLKRAREELNAKILGGIFPIVSYKNACFMNNEIAGITVSEEIICRYKELSREKASELAVEISLQIAEEMRLFTDGWYLMTPFKRIDLVSKIAEKLKK